MTHPESRDVGAILSNTMRVPQNATMEFFVSHHLSGDQIGDYELIVRVDGEERMRTIVSKDSVGEDGWQKIKLQLGEMDEDNESGYKDYFIEIVNQPNGWSWEAMYIADLNFYAVL